MELTWQEKRAKEEGISLEAWERKKLVSDTYCKTRNDILLCLEAAKLKGWSVEFVIEELVGMSVQLGTLQATCWRLFEGNGEIWYNEEEENCRRAIKQFLKNPAYTCNPVVSI